MLFLFLSLMAFAILLVYLEDYFPKEGKFGLYVTLCIALILTTGLKPIGFDNDSDVYESIFNSTEKPSPSILVEYSFIWISNLLKNIHDDIHIVFLFYAILAVCIKFYSIYRLTPLVSLALVIYIGNFYLLHDCIQIRASVASAFFLLSIKPFSDGRKWLGAIWLLIALFFHYSSLILFVVLLLSNKPLSIVWRIALACLVPIGLFMFVMHINPIASLPIPYIEEKLTTYEELKNKGIFDEISIFNVLVWMRIIIFLYALYFYNIIYEHCKYLPLILKIMGISIFSFFALSSIPILSERVNELFGIVEILLFPCIYYTIRPESAAKAIVCLIAVATMFYRLFRLHTFVFNSFAS